MCSELSSADRGARSAYARPFVALLEALQLSGFAGEASIAEIGAALGDTGRVRMLTALLGNEAVTAGELAHEARVTPQTASGHLTRLIRQGSSPACVRVAIATIDLLHLLSPSCSKR